jgi:CheY-like chemotaxis protein/anti-sigma regulatory factor (Ser/Thr protein kinase)
VRADEKRLRQILINLLGNAVKFTSTGAVTFRVSHRREMARFEIVDSGPGMDAAELARVFEPFVRGSSAGAAAGGGTGLGLTIGRMLTDLMGGEMTVDSTPGAGSTFRLTLFLPEVSAATVDERAAPHARSAYAGPRRRILVVDNEEADRGLLASVLQPRGFTLLQAASGEEALALLHGLPAAERPDAVFMDLAMPGIDGWETLRRIGAYPLTGDAPAAIVSANAFDQALDNDVGIAPADFFVKPVRVPDLLDWLGARLRLAWLEAPRAAEPPAPSLPLAAVRTPPAAALQALDAVVALGYPRGILRQLDAIEREHPESAGFTEPLRELVRGFQLDALAQRLRALRPSPIPSPSEATGPNPSPSA